jgi:hypothetical protein
MHASTFIKIIRPIFIKIIYVLGLIVLSWLILKWFYPSPIVFWHGELKNGTVPFPQGFTLEFKLAFLKNSSLIIAACARDIGGDVFGFRDRIGNITSLFGEYRIFIGESDSSDNTLMYLHQWGKENDRVTIRTYGNLSHNMTMRSVRIAYCRNNLLDEIRSTDLFRQPKRTFYMSADPDRSTKFSL